MQNIAMEVNGNELIIRIDTSKRYGQSKSGKSVIVASTNGNTSIPENPEIKIGINCYTK